MGKLVASKKLKSRNCAGDTKNAIANNAMTRNEELEEVHCKDLEQKHPAFAIRQRNNFCYESFTGSPMNNLGLDLAYSILSITY